MFGEVLIRFVIGGVVVSLFSIAADMLRPKSFSGLFAAAPSVALATLGMAIAKHGGAYAAIEGRSMIAGAIALCIYSQIVSWFLMRKRLHAMPVTLVSTASWFAVAFGIWFVCLR